jgi:hypothetical protein
MNNLASTLHAQGDLAAARALQESALATRRRKAAKDKERLQDAPAVSINQAMESAAAAHMKGSP